MEINNRKAKYDYNILEEIECGIELVGTEVKSIRNGSVNLKDSYAIIKNGEAYLLNTHISLLLKRETKQHLKALLQRQLRQLMNLQKSTFQNIQLKTVDGQYQKIQTEILLYGLSVKRMVTQQHSIHISLLLPSQRRLQLRHQLKQMQQLMRDF